MQQLAEYEKDVREAREQIGPMQESIEGQLQAMKVFLVFPCPSVEGITQDLHKPQQLRIEWQL